MGDGDTFHMDVFQPPNIAALFLFPSLVLGSTVFCLAVATVAGSHAHQHIAAEAGIVSALLRDAGRTQGRTQGRTRTQ